MDYVKRNLPWFLAVLLMVVAAVWVTNRPQEVEIVSVVSEELTEILAVSGQVRGATESKLAPETSGTLTQVAVQEGEKVKAGQVLARLDQSRLKAAAEESAQKVQVAKAQLAVASRGPLSSELEEARSEAARREKVAAATLESARQRLAQAREGPRVEQVRQARAELQQARATRQQRARDLTRQQELYSQGAVSQQTFEQARTALEEAEAAEERARQRLTELQVGTRPEELEQARQEVARAEAELRGARTTGQSQVQQLLDRPRPEDIELARAQLQQAQAAEKVAQEQLDQTVVRAPYDGVVGRKLLHVGDLAGPNAPVLTLASRPNLEVRVDIDESELGRVEVGQEAEVRASGFSEPFQARVAEFAGEVDSLKGTIEARLNPVQAPDWLVSGQTVDVNIILSPKGPKLLVPLTSVVLLGDEARVFMIEADRLKEKKVSVLSPTEKGYLVESGLEAGQTVVRYPQGLKDGQKVRTKRSDWP